MKNDFRQALNILPLRTGRDIGFHKIQVNACQGEFGQQNPVPVSFHPKDFALGVQLQAIRLLLTVPSGIPSAPDTQDSADALNFAVHAVRVIETGRSTHIPGFGRDTLRAIGRDYDAWEGSHFVPVRQEAHRILLYDGDVITAWDCRQNILGAGIEQQQG